MKAPFLPVMILCIILVTSAKAQKAYVSSDGYPFEVNLKLQKDTIMLGEPTYMDFEIKNLSVVDLGVAVGGDYRNEYGRPESFDVTVVDPHGMVLPKSRLMTMGGLWGFQKAPIGGSYDIRLYLSHWADIQQIGKYKILVKKELNVRKYSSDSTSALSAKDPVLINIESSITVVSPDYEKMGEVLNSLGERLIARDDTSERLVPFVMDDRIIGYLAEAIKKTPSLIRYLAKFNDDRALNAILSRRSDTDAEVRRNVSVALSLSVHPTSKIYLLKMRTDKNVGIRLDIVHYLGKTKTAESTRILIEMINDEDKRIGSEVRRYLKERGEIVD